MFVIQFYSKSSASILSAGQATALPYSTKSTIFAVYLLSFLGLQSTPALVLAPTIKVCRVLLLIGFYNHITYYLLVETVCRYVLFQTVS